MLASLVSDLGVVPSDGSRGSPLMAATLALTAWARASPNAQPGSDFGVSVSVASSLVVGWWVDKVGGLGCRRGFQGWGPAGAGFPSFEEVAA